MQLNLTAGRPEETLSKLYPVEQTESHPAPSKWKTCNTRQWTNFGDKPDYNHGQNSWDTFAFLGRFPIHTGPTPPLTPQTMLDACIQNFFRVSTLYRVGEGELQENFEKDALF